MSEMQQEASLERRRFTKEFKRDAVRLVAEEGYTFKAAATAVGVSDQSLRARQARPEELIHAALEAVFLQFD